MAKRTNPFIEDFVPQSKVHVGMKQFNNNEDRLKKVYEKTLFLLFMGAKNCPAQEIISEGNALSATDKRNKMKQLFIGKDGTLLHSGNMVDSKPGVKQCTCGSGGESQCAYCDVNLCSGCQHDCFRCERSHCLRCTMIGELFRPCLLQVTFAIHSSADYNKLFRTRRRHPSPIS